MLTKEMKDLLQSAQTYGWVMEPFAKQLLALAGMDVPQFTWARSPDEAISFARKVGYPLVMKIVSPQVVHKSDIGGVVVGIDDDLKLTNAFNRMSKVNGFSGVIAEEMIKGIELIVGAIMDEQFGPVILLGLGGTTAEIYRDISLAMAPLCEADVSKMIRCLKAVPLLEGFRGSERVNIEALKGLVIRFSEFVMDLGDTMESLDLNPVMCSAERCVIADARIMVRT
ncbi:MAG: acetate--CoA ligase family protein [Syntrophorhabdus sp.]